MNSKRTTHQKRKGTHRERERERERGQKQFPHMVQDTVTVCDSEKSE
jgi:hypothetical protein